MKSGGTPSTSRTDFYGGEIPFVSIEDMTGCEKYLLSTKKTLTHAGLDGSNAWLVPSNSILYSIYATLGVPRINLVPVATNQAILAMICRPQLVDQGFLYYWLDYARESLVNANSSQTTQKNLSKSVIGTFSVDHPHVVAEQSKIAEVLSTVDRAIAQTEALVAKQQRIKTGLMQDLLTRGIDEHGQLRSEATHTFKDSALGRIPVEWEVNLLDVVAERGSGHTPSKQHQEYWNGGVKWISLADSSALDRVHINETEYEISDLGLKNSSAVLHPAGTVVLSRDAGVGKSAVMQTCMAVSQHFMAWRCGERLHNYFLYYWLQRDKPRFEGIASGSTIVTIGLQFFKKYQIAHPSDPNEQLEIAKVLLKSEEDGKRSEETLVKLQSLKTALMQDLLTGKVRVTPLLPQAETASA